MKVIEYCEGCSGRDDIEVRLTALKQAAGDALRSTRVFEEPAGEVGAIRHPPRFTICLYLRADGSISTNAFPHGLRVVDIPNELLSLYGLKSQADGEVGIKGKA